MAKNTATKSPTINAGIDYLLNQPTPVLGAPFNLLTLSAEVSFADGPLLAVRTAMSNLSKLGLDTGLINAESLASGIGRLMADSRKAEGRLTGKGGRDTVTTTFKWADCGKAGLLTPLQVKLFEAQGACAKAASDARKALLASK